MNSFERRALVCDVALPFVRSALAEAPGLDVDYEATRGDGTDIRLISGDPTLFDRNVRAAVARANQ